MSNQDKFQVTHGHTLGSKQVIFFYVDKVTQTDIDIMLEREFPDIPRDKINFIPGSGYIMITTGTSVEVPPH